MIGVADASPLCYLILVGEIDLLPQLFSQVIVPQAVIFELQHIDAPEVVRRWASNLPLWVSVQETADLISAGLEKLQAGERSAILLAEFVGADLIIIDEKAARQIAGQRGLSVTGVLGVIGEAATLGLVDLTLTIDRLRKTSFRCSAALFKATLEKYGGRRREWNDPYQNRVSMHFELKSSILPTNQEKCLLKSNLMAFAYPASQEVNSPSPCTSVSR